jgi:hypothetical protein
MVSSLWKEIWQFLGYLQKYVENLGPHKKKAHIFTEHLFIAAKIWRKPICPTTGKIVSKLQHTVSGI